MVNRKRNIDLSLKISPKERQDLEFIKEKTGEKFTDIIVNLLAQRRAEIEQENQNNE